MRHIQLKASYREAKTAYQKVNVALAVKPSGCVIWTKFEEKTLELGPFLWFGSSPGQPLDLTPFAVGRHTKANADGEKLERPSIRVLPRAAFVQLATIGELVDRLFGPCVVNCPSPV
jgi:hypothetical protein